MASVHFRRTLIHQCTVQRSTESQTDTGQVSLAWSDVGVVNCRFVQKQERKADEPQAFVTWQGDLVLMNSGEDVLIEDRLTDIVFRRTGASVDAGPFDIEAVLERNTSAGHHLSLQVERVDST
jgi:hypothetical protein